MSALVIIGVLKPFSSRKSRMRKKIIQELSEGYNRDNLLLPAIEIRDKFYFQSVLFINRIFLKKFYTLFMESIRELEREKEIVSVSNKDLESTINREEGEQYPSYPSRARKKLEDYGFKKDDPGVYLGLNASNVTVLIESRKERNTYQPNRQK